MQNVILSPVAVSDLVDMIASEVQSRLSNPAPCRLEKLLSPKQVTELLDVDNSTLWRWRQSGYLLPIKVGGKIRYKLSVIEKILQTENV